MPNGRRTLLVPLGLLCLSGLALQHCASKPSPPPSPVFTPVGTLQEVMEDIIDPASDVLFEAVATDITPTGIVDKKPTNDAEWDTIRHNALMLVEATNLIKMARPIAQPGNENKKSDEDAPELTPAEIQVKKDANPALWDKYTDELRAASLKALDATRKKDADQLFAVGDAIDMACENCHLEYWYPADKQKVLDESKKRAIPGPGAPAQ